MADIDDSSSLAGLVARLDQHAGSIAGDPETLAYFRRTWSRLSAQQRLTHSLARLPENAGPLNSHQLVHRALAIMRELSPAYFERFGAYLDELLAVEAANASREANVAATRKPPRTRR